MAFAFMENLTLREFVMVNEASGQTRFFDTKLWHVIVMAVVFGAGLQATWQNFFWLHQSLRNDLILDATGAPAIGSIRAELPPHPKVLTANATEPTYELRGRTWNTAISSLQ